MTPRDFINRTTALTAARTFHEAVVFLLFLRLARTDQAGYGLLSFGLGLSFLVFSLLDMGVDQYTLREFSRDRQPPPNLLPVLIRYKLLMGLALLLGVGVVLHLMGWEVRSLALILGLCLARAADSLAESFLSVFRARSRQVLEALLTGAAVSLGGLAGGILLFLGWGLAAVVLFLVAASGLRLILALLLGKRSGILIGLSPGAPPPGNLAWLREHWRSLGGFAGIFVLGVFFNRIQTLILKQDHPLTELAIFGTAFDLTGITVFFLCSLMLNQVLFPELVRRTDEPGDSFQEMLVIHFRNLILLGLGTAFFLYTLGGPLLVLIYGEAYAPAGAPTRILSWAVLLSLINNYLVLVFMAQDRLRLLLWIYGAAALSSLVLGFVLIPAWGARGAASNLLISRAIMALFLVRQAQLSHRLLARLDYGTLGLGALLLVGPLAALGSWNQYLAAAVSLGLFLVWVARIYLKQAKKT